MAQRGPEPQHGTMRRYRRPWRCRCEHCRAANAEWQRCYRRGLEPPLSTEVVTPPPEREPAGHGTRACYNRGCREPECVQANRDYAREYARFRGRDMSGPGYRELEDLDQHLW